MRLANFITRKPIFKQSNPATQHLILYNRKGKWRKGH